MSGYTEQGDNRAKFGSSEKDLNDKTNVIIVSSMPLQNRGSKSWRDGNSNSSTSGKKAPNIYLVHRSPYLFTK